MPYITSIERIGRQEGRREQADTLVLRQLTRRCGTLSPALLTQIQALSLEQMENLADDLLDFSGIQDLEDWLNQQL
ncbi:DUF4351 domain-containing protein [Synechococcus elongatus PCC 6311]|uniref:DUF4351 domain-containing protein n=2 Tax=Synechococcus elongatus TaxID=32046 RepID=Q31PC7_SYNE7|nr:DUF4351 domain-containing protein [Synechococcus elongatus]MBD2587494.1 DUF4351 domain-containing protein [Synechococcus elongatus FACHB-242]UOW70870.1 DUF4351 domain-containing protein [Synechococcus elongatus PCC 7943]UOW73591.1 DUF4351 domain-containing protein [Synechococcus elongatus PCC 6311]UOW76311.1 DUF4351 domain-containing protein [Synechococcus elongatus PCC 6301]ABB57092.1 conserved hypothetical protein [Synechococcus elongatus PCC 7942 = FACHB-805]